MEEQQEKEEVKHGAPGSLALALIFLAFFILMYFVNWKLLSETWAVR